MTHTPNSQGSSHAKPPVDLEPTIGMGEGQQASFKKGKSIGEYVILEPIGGGGGGRVFRAQHQRMDRLVAIKFLNRSLSGDPQMQQRFMREVQTAAKLLHPNIVTAFDAGQYENNLYLVMEFVEGESLAEHIARKGPIPLREATFCIVEVARALQYAHSEGIIHRDIKPGNIMLDHRGCIKVLDMGLARFNESRLPDEDTNANNDLTGHGYLIGTVGYISPEQVVNSHDVDHRTDIYGLGCTFHFLLTGKPPFSGTVMQTLIAHARDPAPSLSDVGKGLPVAVDQVFQKMLAKDRNDRYATMNEVIDDLQLLVGDLTHPASIPAHHGENAKPRVDGMDAEGNVDTNAGADETRISTTDVIPKAIGFDIGTNTTHASWINADGFPISIASSTPSVVAFDESGFRIGQDALDNVQTDIAEHFVCNLGTDLPHQVLGGRKLPPELLKAVLVHKIGQQVRRQAGYFTHIAYTVPGCFGEVQRTAYHDAYRIASMTTFDPINASTAVGIYFGFLRGWLNPQRPPTPKTFLVFRFGGGSFDATVIRFANRSFKTLAIEGDPALGGHVWDERVVQAIAKQLENKHSVNFSSDPGQLVRLRHTCEAAKVALARRQNVPLTFATPSGKFEGTLSRAYLERVGADLLDRAWEHTNKAMIAAGLAWSNLDYVFLAGGTAQMPHIRRALTRHILNERIEAIPPEAAAHGAALYAQTQVNPRSDIAFEIDEVTTHFFGVMSVNPKTREQQVTVVIPKNTPMPTNKSMVFSTSQADQTSIALNLVEGRDPAKPAETNPIGRCNIVNLPPGLPKGATVNLQFHVTKTGLLSVFLESASTGRQTAPQIDRVGTMSHTESSRWREWLDTGMICGHFE